jgi:hypothetical protein
LNCSCIRSPYRAVNMFILYYKTQSVTAVGRTSNLRQLDFRPREWWLELEFDTNMQKKKRPLQQQVQQSCHHSQQFQQSCHHSQQILLPLSVNRIPSAYHPTPTFEISLNCYYVKTLAPPPPPPPARISSTEHLDLKCCRLKLRNWNFLWLCLRIFRYILYIWFFDQVFISNQKLP